MLVCLNLMLVLITSCAGQEFITKEILAENVLKALQEDDFDLFKECLPGFELVQNSMNEIDKSGYNQKMTEMFITSQNAFSKGGFNIRDFEISIINEPYRVYEHEGHEYIRFEVILKNISNFYLTVVFSDCIKTENGYKLGEPLSIAN